MDKIIAAVVKIRAVLIKLLIKVMKIGKKGDFENPKVLKAKLVKNLPHIFRNSRNFREKQNVFLFCFRTHLWKQIPKQNWLFFRKYECEKLSQKAIKNILEICKKL